ncbi:MAG: hypothetical protein V1799_11880 [bacterium]
MSYKIRNSIVISAVLVLVVAAGLVYWGYFQPKKLLASKAELDKIEQELQNLPSTMKEVYDLSVTLTDTKRKYDSRSKIIPSFDITSQTYAYISQGVDEVTKVEEEEPKFNLDFTGSKDFGAYGYNTYLLSEGEGEFESLYKFVYFLENGNRLYKINWITFEGKETADEATKTTKKWLAFTLELHAYYTSIQELGTSLAAKSLTSSQAPFNPFNPYIVQSLPMTAPEDEIDPTRVEVRAVLPGKAFVMYMGDLIILHLGDQVWRGYVSKISTTDGKVEFKVNEGGISKIIEKKILFEKSIKKR